MTGALRSRSSDWARARVLVAGFGVSGSAATDAMVQLGSSPVCVDDHATGSEYAELLGTLGADLRFGPGSTDIDPRDFDVVVSSPGWPDTAPLIQRALRSGVPVWSDVELAWRLRGPDAAPWLAVTGTNGKTTTVQMLDAILRADGLRSRAVGNVGTAVIEAVMDPEPYDVLAVELSSYQLHRTFSMAPRASAVLNVAPDHLDWHGGLDAYTADKGRIYENTEIACVYNAEDPITEVLVEDADVVEGCRAIGFTLGVPGLSMLGVVDAVLADRAFTEERRTSAVELANLADVRPAAPHNVANALAAAALARAHGVAPQSVAAGLRGFSPDAHRLAPVGAIGGVEYVDDSKATNPHAALAALRGFSSVVWIAGGLAKGAEFDDLVEAAGDRLRAVVLLGRDRRVIADALARHAPDVPVIEVATEQTEAMARVVAAAADVAQPGDTVLLAPGCASMDMYVNYAARGDAFARAVRERTDQEGP